MLNIVFIIVILTAIAREKLSIPWEKMNYTFYYTVIFKLLIGQDIFDVELDL